MPPKDIEAVDDLERAVRADPTVLPDIADRIDARLAGEDLTDRLDAGRALRAAASHDPELVEPHVETLVALLSSEQGSLQLSGAIGVAEYAGLAPEDPRVLRAVPRLVELLDETVAPAIEEATVRTLGRVGMRDPAAVTDADPVVAALFREATFPTRTVICKWFVRAVAEDPRQFPETVAAYAAVVADEDDAMARFAAEAIARVASADPGAVSDPARVLADLEALEAKVDADPRRGVGEGVRDAARTFRELHSANG
ncbi:hypothetical protein [Halomarina litorea]|uniref:hypothetical protein n=1 Tax=Halomarina litorea TaxID=2961595 RepID=UPI0020C24988|nr:hypothetical protein [Halomarina sp. BCD28]